MHSPNNYLRLSIRHRLKQDLGQVPRPRMPPPARPTHFRTGEEMPPADPQAVPVVSWTFPFHTKNPASLEEALRQARAKTAEIEAVTGQRPTLVAWRPGAGITVVGEPFQDRAPKEAL